MSVINILGSYILTFLFLMWFPLLKRHLSDHLLGLHFLYNVQCLGLFYIHLGYSFSYIILFGLSPLFTDYLSIGLDICLELKLFALKMTLYLYWTFLSSNRPLHFVDESWITILICQSFVVIGILQFFNSIFLVICWTFYHVPTEKPFKG